IGAAIELRIENGQSLASALCRLLDGGDVALLCRGANDAEKDRRDNVCVKRRIGPLHPLVGKGALALVGGAQAAAAVCGDEIAHDHVALPQHEPVILQHRNETVRVELAELRRVEAAKWAADVDALVRQLELCHRPHHLLDVDRRLAPPNLQHLAPPPRTCRAHSADNGFRYPNRKRARGRNSLAGVDHSAGWCASTGWRLGKSRADREIQRTIWRWPNAVKH